MDGALRANATGSAPCVICGSTRRVKFPPEHTDSYCLLDVRLDPLDASAALARLAKRLAEKV